MWRRKLQPRGRVGGASNRYSTITSHRFSLVGQLHRCHLRAAVCSQSRVFVPLHEKDFWLLLVHNLWYSDAYTGWFIVPRLWSVFWSYELCVCLVCYTFHPHVAPSIGVVCENLVVHCEVLLRSTVPVMWKDFLQHKYQLSQNCNSKRVIAGLFTGRA